jgi:uncharacterized membrane protein YcaP (DUF421 family)
MGDAFLGAVLWLFGQGQDLEWWQMAARGVVMFFILLVCIRISGRRSFGQGTPVDTCMAVMVGAVLSRAVVGVSPWWPTVAGGLALALTHRLVALASWRWPAVDRLVSGRERELVRAGRVDREQTRKGLISQGDLRMAVRQKTGQEGLQEVARAVLERDGKVTVVPRREEQ